MSGLPIKIIKVYNIRGSDVVFEVEYLWEQLDQKKQQQRVNANTTIDFIISFGLSNQSKSFFLKMFTTALNLLFLVNATTLDIFSSSSFQTNL